jgi:hypothetical protein
MNKVNLNYKEESDDLDINKPQDSENNIINPNENNNALNNRRVRKRAEPKKARNSGTDKDLKATPPVEKEIDNDDYSYDIQPSQLKGIRNVWGKKIPNPPFSRFYDPVTGLPIFHKAVRKSCAPMQTIRRSKRRRKQ